MEIVGKALACERGGRLVFENLDVHATGGRMLVLRGPNGAGKTSLLRLLAGLAEPAAGDLNLTGAPGDGDMAGQVHFVAHQDAIKLHLTVEENLTFWSGFLGGGDIETALDAMNLAPSPQEVSGPAPVCRSEAAAGPCPACACATPGLAARRTNGRPRYRLASPACKA
jgi:ABC-type transport system involved in cytochrome c biogenesis ATPase subunit